MPAQLLIEYLDRIGVDYQLQAHPPAYTAVDVAQVNHLNGHSLAKSVMVKLDAVLTMIVVPAHYYLDFELLGETIDDAAGEAFDKTGKMLGLEYPAGPLIDKLAQKGTPHFHFPEPKIPDLNFSFSGLKTSILYFLKKQIKINPNFIQENLADICASVQDRIVSILMNKLKKAAEQTGIEHIAIAGGVSANSSLRSALEKAGREHGWTTYIPRFEYCTDNAAMIAITGYYRYQRGLFVGHDVVPVARMKVSL